jgi:hypothetical protein
MIKIAESLARSFEEHANDPEHREAVIVTLNSDADASELARRGMAVTRKMKNQPIVMGTVDAAALKALSEWDGVTRIEGDSADMHAL